jgi:hypothetical protein
MLRRARVRAWGVLLVLSSSGAFAQAPDIGSSGRAEPIADVCIFKKNASGQFIPPSAERVYQAHRRSALLRAYDKNCDGIPDDKKVAAALSDPDRDFKLKHVGPPLIVVEGANQSEASTGAYAGAALAKAVGAKPAKSGPADMSPKQAQPCPVGLTGYPIVRDSYADLTVVKITDCPPDLGKAKGATFSFTRDNVAQNTQWAAQGVAGERFLWYTNDPCAGPCVSEIAVAPIVAFERLTNSNAKLVSKNLDVLSPGFSSEVFVEDPLNSPLQLYFRARANANGDFEGDVNSWSGTFEFQPVYGPLRIGTKITIGHTFWYVAPVVRTQYFARTGKDTDPIFAASNHVLRIGPGVAVAMRPLDQDPVPAWLQNFLFGLSYDWFHDTVSNQNVHYLLTSLSYSVTQNFGITLSYEQGKVEQTGQDVETTKLALSVKY